jgi:diguanylate cyclase
LQDLATHMADNVDQHSSRVEQINQELNLANAGNPEAVVSAVARLIEANQQMQEQLKTTETKLHEQAQLVETRSAEARTDALTALPNRRAFDDELNRRFAEFRRYRRKFSLIMGDVDHFKRFNDEQGHQSGDEVLRGVARVLRTAARGADIVARYGGEEFAVILPDTAGDTGAKCLERIRQSVDTVRFRLLSGEIHVTLSFGLAEVRTGEDPAALIRRADEALYASKAAGRNRGSWHDGKTIHAIARPTDAPPENAVPPAPVTPPDARTATADQRNTLCSRNEFCLNVGRRLAECQRKGPPPGVLLMRVDGYSALISEHGPEAGAVVLRSTIQFLEASIREMDVGTVYGEATFAMLLCWAKQSDLINIAERLRQAISRCVLPLRGSAFQFTVSMACAVAVPGEGAPTLLARAEEALQSATTAGGNCIFCHTGQRPEPAAMALEAIT